MNTDPPDFTPAEHDIANRIALTTPHSRRQALDMVRSCRGAGVSPETVAAYAASKNLDIATALQHLKLAAEAERAGSSSAAAALAMVKERTRQPAPAQLHLREPKTKAERRLVRDIQAAVNARNAAMGQLARANRAVAKAEQGLRVHGMITGESAGPSQGAGPREKG